MITLEKITIKNFFSVSHAEIELENQGLVVVHGRVASGKTAITCESVLYGLYGSSFEYGQNPGQAIKKNTEKDFSVVIWLRSESDRFRIMRGKDPSLKLNGLELHRIRDDGTEDRLTRGTTKDTQKLITEGLLKISERLFRRSVVCSTDMGKFPDASDSEKKSILDELLGLWIVSNAYEETVLILKALRSDINVLNREYELACNRLSEEESYSRQDIDELMAKLKKCRNAIAEKTDEIGQLEEAVEVKSRSIETSIEEAKGRLKSIGKAPSDEIAEARSLIKSIEKKMALVESGKCQTCGQDTSELCDGHDLENEHSEASRRLESLLGERDRIETERQEASNMVDKLTTKYRKLISEYSSIKRELDSEILKLNNQSSSIRSEIERSEDIEERINKARKVKDETAEKILSLRKTIEEEEVLEELFSNKGCRLSIIRSVIPFMNQEAERVSLLLNTPIRVKFAIRGTDESYSGNLSVEVYNPLGAWQYHGSSAGERRTIDIIILMCLISLNNRRNNKFNHVFFDETFEKLDPPLQRAVLQLLRDISKNKSSVFLITHSATEIRQEVDQTWEVSRGGALTISKS